MRLRWIIVPLVLVSALAACSDDTGSTTDTTTPAAVTTAPVGESTLAFHPVLAVLPTDACDRSTPDDELYLDEVDGSPFACFEVGPPPVDRVAIESAEAIYYFEDEWQVAPVLTDAPDGIGALNELAGPCFTRAETCRTGQVAMVVDGELLSAPTIQTESFEPDQIVIAGDFDQAEAEELADTLAP